MKDVGLFSWGRDWSSFVVGPHFCGRICTGDTRGPMEDVASQYIWSQGREKSQGGPHPWAGRYPSLASANGQI